MGCLFLGQIALVAVGTPPASRPVTEIRNGVQFNRSTARYEWKHLSLIVVSLSTTLCLLQRPYLPPSPRRSLAVLLTLSLPLAIGQRVVR